jgi:hypothetical protein
LDAVYWFLMLFTSGDVDRLGSESWPARESAEERLRLMGPLAWPELARHAADESPEVRARVRRLLAPYASWCGELTAADILLSPWPVDGLALWGDLPLRRRVMRQAAAAGYFYPGDYYEGGLPLTEAAAEWTPDQLAEYVGGVRRHLGVEPPWWMR